MSKGTCNVIVLHVIMAALAAKYQLNFSNYFHNLNEGLCLFNYCQRYKLQDQRDDDAGYLSWALYGLIFFKLIDTD